jgi:hypothetical protein
MALVQWTESPRDCLACSTSRSGALTVSTPTRSVLARVIAGVCFTAAGSYEELPYADAAFGDDRLSTFASYSEAAAHAFMQGLPHLAAYWRLSTPTGREVCLWAASKDASEVPLKMPAHVVVERADAWQVVSNSEIVQVDYIATRRMPAPEGTERWLLNGDGDLGDTWSEQDIFSDLEAAAARALAVQGRTVKVNWHIRNAANGELLEHEAGEFRRTKEDGPANLVSSGLWCGYAAWAARSMAL